MTTFGDGIDWDKEAQRAAAHDAIGAPAGCEMLDIIMSEIGQRQNLRAVDCGCNIGQFFPMFEKAGFDYVGLDQAAQALQIARRRWPKARFMRTYLWSDWLGVLAAEAVSGGVSTVDGTDEAARERVRFDVAICCAVLQHNKHEEKERILPRIADAVRVGGLFAIQESTVTNETATQLRHDQWIALVERYGFQLIKTWHKNELGHEDGYLFRRVA